MKLAGKWKLESIKLCNPDSEILMLFPIHRYFLFVCLQFLDLYIHLSVGTNSGHETRKETKWKQNEILRIGARSVSECMRHHNKKRTNNVLCGRDMDKSGEWEPTKLIYESAKVKPIIYAQWRKNYCKHFEHYLASIKIFLCIKCMVETNSLQGWLIPYPRL